MSEAQAGAVIGPGGAKISEIRKVSGAHVQITDDFLPESTERACIITGTVKQVPLAVYHVAGVLAQATRVAGKVIRYDPAENFRRMHPEGTQPVSQPPAPYRQGGGGVAPYAGGSSYGHAGGGAPYSQPPPQYAAGYGGQAQQGYGGGGQAQQGYGGQAQQGYGGQAQQGYGGQAQQGYGGQAQQGYGGQAQQGYGAGAGAGAGAGVPSGYGGQQQQRFSIPNEVRPLPHRATRDY